MTTDVTRLRRNLNSSPNRLGPWRRWRIALWTCCVCLGFGLLVPTSIGQDKAATTAKAAKGGIVLLNLKSAIGFVSVQMLNKAIARAENERASVLVVRLDTPGGLVSSTREMIQSILASRVPVVVYVAPSGARAASAGTFLIYASHVAAMAPGTHLGAATPIRLGVPGMPGTKPSKPKEDDDKSNKKKKSEPAAAGDRKSLNDAIAYIRSLAQLRKRNVEFAEKAVREASTLTAREALKQNVIEIVAQSTTELLQALDGRRVETTAGPVTLATKGRVIIEIKPDWKMKVLSAIADPNIAFILFLIGVYGIIFELMNPGMIGSGVVGAICLLLAMTALSVLPVSYGGLALIILGILLMVSEALVPGIGILGIGGVVALILGAIFLFDPADADIPFGVAWQVIVGAALASIAIVLGVLGTLVHSRRAKVTIGAEDIVGSVGVVESWSDDQGLVRYRGEVWSARSAQSLDRGARVRVTGREGLTLIVEGS